MKDSDHWVVGVCPDDPLALVQGRLYPEITANCVIAWRRNIPYSQAVNKMIEEINAYDEIILGFPIWWYVAPTIVNTFLEKYNFSGKKIILFATSGGSGFGNTARELQTSAPDSVITEGKIFHNVVKQHKIDLAIEVSGEDTSNEWCELVTDEEYKNKACKNEKCILCNGKL